MWSASSGQMATSSSKVFCCRSVRPVQSSCGMSLDSLSVRQGLKCSSLMAFSCEKTKYTQVACVQIFPFESSMEASMVTRFLRCSLIWARMVRKGSLIEIGCLYWVSMLEVTPAVWSLRVTTHPHVSSNNVACMPPCKVSTHP